MLKEKGYEAYLAQKIQQGLSDVEEGRIFTLEQANAEWQSIIEQIDEDNRQFERDVVYG